MTAQPHRRNSWPPYTLIESSLIAATEARMGRLERLYHVGQEHIWDGRQVLKELIAKHGQPRLPADKRDSALKVLSLLLWGELAAWAISADLAERIDDIEAKMAATSQAHDEARHFYVLRDYLQALGEPVPRLGGIGRRLLLSVLETPSLTCKLIGMQLMTESNALAIFRGLVESRLEPVLTELLPYYEKDEARHVGLGVMYLPRLLKQLSRVERAGVVAFQLRSLGMLMSGGLTMHAHFRNLGCDPRKMAQYTVGLQDQVLRDMRDESPHSQRNGLLNPAHGLGPKVLDFIHPPRGMDQAPAWHQAVMRLWSRGAHFADKALA